MAIVNKCGVSVSYECSDLIAELEKDIKIFGKQIILFVLLKTDEVNEIEYITNYDFMPKGRSIEKEELKEDDRIICMTAGFLMEKLENQNSIF